MAVTAPKITADQATKSKANALAFQAQNLAQRNTTPAPVQKVTADQATQSKANALAFQAQNLAQRNPTSTPTNVGSTITAGNTRTPQPTVLAPTTQPTQGTMLSSDIMAGQEATNQARLAELAVSQGQGKDTTTQAKQIADYLAGKTATTTPQGTTTPTTGTSPTNAPIDAVSQYKTNFEQSQSDLMGALANAQGQTTLQDQAYSGTVDPAKQELNTINQQINEVSLASRRRKEAVLTIPGMTKEQAQDKLNEIDRQDTSKLADLAIIQMAKQGQYDSAKEIADRKVSALIEEQKIKIDTLKFVYDNNKELFTKAEQRQFEVAQADRERKLNQEEKRLQEVNAIALSALESGAPASVVTKMFNAKTLAEATKLGGQYVGALDRQSKKLDIAYKQAQIGKIYQDIANDRISKLGGNLTSLSYEDNAKFNSTPQVKAINDTLPYINAVKQYKDAIKKYGTGEVFGKDAGTLNQSYAELVGRTKDFYKLGTYDNGVQKLIDLGIKEPSVFGLKSNRLGALDEAFNSASKELERNVNELSTTRYANTIQGQQLIQSSKAIIDTDKLSNLSNEQLLQSIPTTSGSTPAINNNQFFNR